MELKQMNLKFKTDDWETDLISALIQCLSRQIENLPMQYTGIFSQKKKQKKNTEIFIEKKFDF